MGLIPTSILTAPFRILDGGLVNFSRDKTVARMAKVLIQGDAFHNEDDAIMLLREKGFTPLEVFSMVPDAMYLAKQEAFAREMSKP